MTFFLLCSAAIDIHHAHLGLNANIIVGIVIFISMITKNI